MVNDMTKGKEWKQILLFTLPIMAGNLLQQLYNTADGIVVGNFVGEDAFSAVGTCAVLTFLFLALAMGLSNGAGILVSQYFGAKMEKDLRTSINTSMILMGILGVIMSVIGVLTARWFLRFVLGVPDEILDDAVLYMQIYCIGLVFQFLYNAASSVLRNLGDSKSTLYFLIVSAVVNILLDLLFVIVFKWGVAGAAIATVIAQLACTVVSIIYMFKRIPKVEGAERFTTAKVKLIMRMGVPAAIQQSIVSLGNMAINRLVNSFGTISIAAFAAGNRIDSFVFVPIIGFQTGIATFTGQNMGAGNVDRVKRGFRYTLLMSIGTVLVIGICLFTFARPVIGFFGLSGASLGRGVEQVKFLAFMFTIFAMNMAFGGILQGSGDVVVQSIATLIALAVRVVVAYVGVDAGWFDYNVAWATVPIGWGAASVIFIARYFSGKWKTKVVAGKLANDDGEK